MAEGGSTTALTVTGGDAATLAKVLRKTERLPLHTLCAQIQAENHRDWARWERSLDFHDTMAGRYGLTCPDQESFTFAPDGASDTQTLPVASYWTLRMTRDAAPAPVPPSPVEDLPLWQAADGTGTHAQDVAHEVQDVAHEICAQLQTLIGWCAEPDADAYTLETIYDSLLRRIHTFTVVRGYTLDCQALQLQVECALMALV